MKDFHVEKRCTTSRNTTMHAAPVQRTILSTRRIMVPPLTLCAYMKKGPNLRWSLIQCSGGDEGDRTPDLLTASQALSQLSYAPVRRSTIRELGRRCKDNFGKTFRGRRLNVGTPADSGQILLSLISEQARHVAWPVEKPGGPSGIRTQNPGIMSPLR